MTNNLSSIVNLISICIGVFGFVLAFFLYLKEKRNKKIKTLVDQVCAYYYEEDVAVKELQKLSPDKSEQKIKSDLRKKAKFHPDNTENLPPKLTDLEAKKYL